jgi:hypothetical protein
MDILISIAIGLAVLLIISLLFSRRDAEVESTDVAASLTPQKIREVGREYELKLTGKENFTIEQLLVLLIVGAPLIGLGIWFSFFFAPRWFVPLQYSLLARLALFLAIFVVPAARARAFFIFVPKYMLAQATDFFSGRLHTFTTGFHFKSPFYIVHPKDYLNVRVIVIEGTSKFVTKEGVTASYVWTVQARIREKLLALNARVSLADIAKAVRDVVENTLSTNFLGKGIETLRDPVAMNDMAVQLREKLNAPLPETVPVPESGVVLDAEKNPIWVRFGVEFEISTLGPPEFAEDYQQAMTAEVISRKVRDTAKKFQEDGVSPDAALNSALILNKESNVRRDAIAIEGIDSKAIASVVTAVTRIINKRKA